VPIICFPKDIYVKGILNSILKEGALTPAGFFHYSLSLCSPFLHIELPVFSATLTYKKILQAAGVMTLDRVCLCATLYRFAMSLSLLDHRKMAASDFLSACQARDES